MDQNATHASPDFIGGLPPPPGVIPNFIDPPKNQVGLIVVGFLGLFLTSVCVWVRVWTKVRITKKVEWEDYASVVAWMGFVANTGLGYLSLRHGIGVHQWDVPLQDVSYLVQLSNVEEILYGPFIFITKLSILLQYLRIFVPNHAGKLYYTVQFIIWLNLVFYIADTLVVIITCMPEEKKREPSTPGRCVDIRIVFLATGAINVISDFSILVLPLSSIWGLQMPRKRKIALSAVFATGLFACIASIMRLVQNVETLNTKDATYDLVRVSIWANLFASAAEMISGIVCGCLPVLPQFFRHYVPRITTKLSLCCQRKRRSHSTEASKPIYSGQSMTHRRAGPLDLPACSGNYLELKERDGLARTQGYSFTVERSQDQERQTFVDLEDGSLKHGIQKTVRIETRS